MSQKDRPFRSTRYDSPNGVPWRIAESTHSPQATTRTPVASVKVMPRAPQSKRSDLDKKLERVGLERGVWYHGERQMFASGHWKDEFCCRFEGNELYVQEYKYMGGYSIDPLRSVSVYGPPEQISSLPLTKALYKMSVRTSKLRFEGDETHVQLYITATKKVHPRYDDEAFDKWSTNVQSDDVIYNSLGRSRYPLKVTSRKATQHERRFASD